MYTLYMHTTPDEKRYVGVTSRQPEIRWGNGWGYYGQPFFDAVKQFGWDNIKHEIIFENLTEEEAHEKERELIAFYNSTDRKYGYNSSSGGNWGTTVSKEARHKLSENLKSQGIKPPSQKGVPNKHRKGVNQYTLDGEFVATYESVNAAARAADVSPLLISNACNKRRKSLNGFIYEFASNANNRNVRPVAKYDLGGNFIAEYPSMRAAALDVEVSINQIKNVCEGISKSAGGFIFGFIHRRCVNESA